MWHFVKRHTITQKYRRKIKSWNHWTLQKFPPQWKSRIAAQKNFPICDSISSILLNGFMHSRYSAFAAMWKPTKSHTHKNAHTYLFAQILRSVYCSANDSITWWNSRHEHFSSGFFSYERFRYKSHPMPHQVLFSENWLNSQQRRTPFYT